MRRDDKGKSADWTIQLLLLGAGLVGALVMIGVAAVDCSLTAGQRWGVVGVAVVLGAVLIYPMARANRKRREAPSTGQPH
jgi:hypothetical protein